MKDLSIAGFNRLNKTGGNTWDILVQILFSAA